MLSTEQKQQIFMKLRHDNFQASLRLEGFVTDNTTPQTSSAQEPLKANHVQSLGARVIVQPD